MCGRKPCHKWNIRSGPWRVSCTSISSHRWGSLCSRGKPCHRIRMKPTVFSFPQKPTCSKTRRASPCHLSPRWTTRWHWEWFSSHWDLYQLRRPRISEPQQPQVTSSISGSRSQQPPEQVNIAEEDVFFLHLKREADKCWWESLCEDNFVGGWKVILLPAGHLRSDSRQAGGHHVAGHGEEPGGKAGLGEEAELDLVDAHGLVVPLPVPPGDVQQIGLIVLWSSTWALRWIDINYWYWYTSRKSKSDFDCLQLVGIDWSSKLLGMPVRGWTSRPQSKTSRYFTECDLIPVEIVCPLKIGKRKFGPNCAHLRLEC